MVQKRKRSRSRGGWVRTAGMCRDQYSHRGDLGRKGRTKPARPKDEATDVARSERIARERTIVDDAPPEVEGIVPVVGEEERVRDREVLDR